MHRPQLSRRAVIATVAGVAVVAAGTSAWAMSGGGVTYRYATTTRGSVTEALTATGAISPVREADLDFQVRGTVGRVFVHAGDHVTAGETVARLDRTSLKAAVTSARSTLDSAEASLSSDESSETSAASTSSPSGSSPSSTSSGAQPTTSASPSPTGGAGSSGQIAARLRRDQRALIDAQRHTDQDLATAKTALTTARSACAAETSGSSTSGSGVTSGSDTTTCTAATRALLADQTTVSADEAKVEAAEEAVSRDLAAGSTTSTSATHSTAADRTASTTAVSRSAATATLTAAVTRTDASTATADSSISDRTATAGTVTAARLASDQATIDTDLATLRSARADLRQSDLTSPITGRIAAITIRKGDAVSGSTSSTSPAVEVVGSRQSQVTISVPATQLRTLRDGMSARVTPDGANRGVTGVVSSIGLTATTDSTTGSSTYPVVVTISRKSRNLVAGSDAAVSIVTSTAHDVVTIPTSAVHRSGSRAYVELASSAGETRHTVTVGTVGAPLTEIDSGLRAGQRVVLADLDAAVPSSSSNLTQGGRGFGSGGFGGNGVGGGTFRISIAPGTGGAPSGAFQSGP